MKGRKPVPTAIRTIGMSKDDTYSPIAHRHINVNEPMAEVIDSPLAAPDYLDEQAKTHWQYVVPILCGMRVMTAADIPQIEQLCCLWSIAIAALKEHQHGNFQQGRKATFSIYRESIALWHKFASDFGLSPAARARLSVAANRPVDELEEFLDGN